MTPKEKQKQRLNKFKNKHKMPTQKEVNQSKKFLVPQTQWENTDILEVRGDILQAIEHELMEGYEALRRTAQALQVLMAQNIKAGKIKVTYVWNNGEPATEEEIKTAQSEMEKIEAERKKQVDEKIKQQEQESLTEDGQQGALVDLNGQPLTKEHTGVGIATGPSETKW